MHLHMQPVRETRAMVPCIWRLSPSASVPSPVSFSSPPPSFSNAASCVRRKTTCSDTDYTLEGRVCTETEATELNMDDSLAYGLLLWIWTTDLLMEYSYGNGQLTGVQAAHMGTDYSLHENWLITSSSTCQLYSLQRGAER